MAVKTVYVRACVCGGQHKNANYASSDLFDPKSKVHLSTVA